MCTAKFFSENVARSNDFFCIGNADLIATKNKLHLTSSVWEQISGCLPPLPMKYEGANKNKFVELHPLPCSLDGPFGREKMVATAQHSLLICSNVKCCDDDHFKIVVPKSLPRPIQRGGGTKHFHYCSRGAQRHHRMKLRDFPPFSLWDNSTPIYTNSCE